MKHSSEAGRSFTVRAQSVAWASATLPAILAISLTWEWIKGPPSTAGGNAVVGACLIALAGITARVLSVRVKIDDVGVHVKGVLRSRELPWDAIAGTRWGSPPIARFVLWSYSPRRLEIALRSGATIAPLALGGSGYYKPIERAETAIDHRLRTGQLPQPGITHKHEATPDGLATPQGHSDSDGQLALRRVGGGVLLTAIAAVGSAFAPSRAGTVLLAAMAIFCVLLTALAFRTYRKQRGRGAG